MPKFGDPNPQLTKAVRRIAGTGSLAVRFGPHAEEAMDQRNFDHGDVLTCLRRGTAHGPEQERVGVLRSRVIHSGLHIAVVVGGLDDVQGDWSRLARVEVVTVMEA